MSINRWLRMVAAAWLLLSGPLHAAEGRDEVTRHALEAPAAAEQTVAGLARYLAPPSFSVEDRAWSIFVWIGDRILYDVDAYLSGRVRDATVTAEDVLKRRVTVCDGYARLYAALARAAGLEVTIIEGYAKAYGVAEQTVFSIPNHAWNLVLRDGRWDVIDPTWGAGYVFQDRYVKQLDQLFFQSQPEELKFTHWPVDAKWRHTVGLKLRKDEFEAQPRVDPGLFRAGVKGGAVSAAIGQPGYRGLVTVFEQNHRGLVVRSIPLTQFLRAGQPYFFQMLARSFDEVVIMNGGRVVALAARDGEVQDEFLPLPGSLLVAGRLKENGRLTGLFQYTVE